MTPKEPTCSLCFGKKYVSVYDGTVKVRCWVCNATGIEPEKCFFCKGTGYGVGHAKGLKCCCCNGTGLQTKLKPSPPPPPPPKNVCPHCHKPL